MKYLSFDIECCDGIHMCEFGYVIFDEQFNIIEKKNFLINPKHKFHLTGRKGGRDLILYYTEEEYKSSPEFSYYYLTIKKLIEAPNQTIVGFSMRDDSKFLATACGIYGEEPIKFEFYDFQDFYKAYTKADKQGSVERFVKELGIEGIILHKSDDDALAVVLGLKKISEIEGLTLPEALLFLQKTSGKYAKEKAIERVESLNKKLLGGHEKTQREYLKNFIAKIEQDIDVTKITRKKVCLGGNYQRFYFNELLALIEELYKQGYVYTGKASESDIFVRFDYFIEEELVLDKRLESVHCAIESEGKTIEIISLDEFLQGLNLTRKTLAKKNMLKLDESTPKMKYKRNNQPRERKGGIVYTSGDAKVTIGDLFGDILAKFNDVN